MLKTDYLIIGLDEMSLELAIKGTAHFINNINSGWYGLEEVLLNPGGEAIMKFMPKMEVASLFHPPKKCTITLPANETFALIVREQYQANEKTTVKYLLLNCRLNKDGAPYFHYDILQKTRPSKKEDENARIHIPVATEQLIGEGFKLIKAYDDEKRSSRCVVLENHRQTA